MFARKLRVRFAFLSVFAIVTPLAVSQQNPDNDPANKPRKIKAEPAKAFKVWIVDVEPIITPEEMKAWSKLQTDEEREQFIGIFWSHRDNDPDTEANEYREEYYERVAYVNEHFSSGVPGIKTDRGRIYLRFGRPDEVDSHPSGGTYQRESWEGSGTTATYPFERWFYRSIPGLAGAEIEFVDPTGSGEYRIARNPFEKEATLFVPGASPTNDGVSQLDRASAASGIGNPFSSRSQDSAFEWMDRIKLITTPPPVDFNYFPGSRTNTPIVDNDSLGTAVVVSCFKQADDRVVVAFTVQTENRDLVFRDVGGLKTARVNISGRITSVAGRRIGFFEDAVTTTATAAELLDAKERKSAYQKAVVLTPGKYRIDLLVRDVESGSAAIRHVGFTVPKYGSELATSGVVLASVLEHVEGEPASRQFLIGSVKVIPNISGTYHRGAPVGVYMQIYNAGIDQTTLRPSVDVEYVLMKDGKEVGKQIEDWRGLSDAAERLTLARMIDSERLVPGDYSIEVRVRDRVSGQALVETAKFTIVK